MTPLDAQAQAMLEAIREHDRRNLNRLKCSESQNMPDEMQKEYSSCASESERILFLAEQAALAVPDDSFEAQCPECRGEGQVPGVKHYVSREMALDAGQPEREGQTMGFEYYPCPRCHEGKLKVREVR
jgi:Zn finger protein HypA/HybF involved in hydrogenase expression